MHAGLMQGEHLSHAAYQQFAMTDFTTLGQQFGKDVVGKPELFKNMEKNKNLYDTERNGSLTVKRNKFLADYFDGATKVTVKNLETFVKEADKILLGRLSFGTKAGAQKKFWVKSNAKAIKSILTSGRRSVYLQGYREKKGKSKTH